jgi:hypothetical protein
MTQSELERQFGSEQAEHPGDGADGRAGGIPLHPGHAFSIKPLLVEVSEAIDNGLWDSIRALEERVLLLRQMSDLPRTDDRG